MRRFQTVLLAIALGFMSGLPSAGEDRGRSASLADVVADVNTRLESGIVSPDPNGTLVIEVQTSVPHSELPGARVQVRAFGCECHEREGQADMSGRVSFAELPAGLYVFGVSMPGHVPHAGIVLLLAEYPAAPRVHQVVTLKESP